MRSDFPKLLTERPRVHPGYSFGDKRHLREHRGSEAAEVGRREPMRARYGKRHDIADDRKKFNENLNPLIRWLQSCLGQRWDKCYGELRRAFDIRSTLNDHILQHLYDYVETHAFLDDDGRAAVLRTYLGEGIVPIRCARADYYVCPKDGTLKQCRPPAKVHKACQSYYARQPATEATLVEIDKDNLLRKIDGVWYHFTMKDVPAVTVTYREPPNRDSFVFTGWWGGQYHRAADKLTHDEFEQLGLVAVTGAAFDMFDKKLVYRPINAPRSGAYDGPSRSPSLRPSGDKPMQLYSSPGLKFMMYTWLPTKRG